MAAVIAFPKQKHRNEQDENVFGPAHILIFTGVRHERLVEIHETALLQTRRLPSRQNQALAEEFE